MSLFIETDRAVVQSEKEAVRDDGMEKFFDKCPKQFASLLQIIDCLKFEQEPPYEKIYDILNDVSAYTMTLLFSFDHFLKCLTLLSHWVLQFET